MGQLLTDVRSESKEASRKWADKDIALKEPVQEGWAIIGPYPNRLSIKLKIKQRFSGYGLIRTVH
jgi:hypothetical protein